MLSDPLRIYNTLCPSSHLSAPSAQCNPGLHSQLPYGALLRAFQPKYSPALQSRFYYCCPNYGLLPQSPIHTYLLTLRVSTRYSCLLLNCLFTPTIPNYSCLLFQHVFDIIMFVKLRLDIKTIFSG